MTAGATQAYCKGIDAYEGQGAPDWLAVRRSGVDFAFVKATQGLYYQDPQFPRNWQRLDWRGIIRGAYHFLDARYDGADQADYLHDYVRRKTDTHFRKGDMVALDLEETFEQEPALVIECAEAFILRALEQIAKTVVLYTYPSFWRVILGMPTSQVFLSCPLWISNPSVNPDQVDRLNWPVISFWQYDTNGTQIGVTGICDKDVFLGDLGRLRKVAGF